MGALFYSRLSPRFTAATAVFLSFLMPASNLLANQSTAQLWSERAAQKENRRSAALPKPVPPIPALPTTWPPASTRPSSLSADIEALLPASAGAVHARRAVPGHAEAPLVVLIQDVHRNEEAQRAIARAMQALFASDKLDFVGLEGTDGTPPLALYRETPHRVALRMAQEHWMRTHTLSGPLYAALNATGTLPTIRGVDSASLHRKNVNAYRRASASNPSGWLARQEAALSRERLAFSGDLRRFDDDVRSYHAGQIPLSRYLDVLGRHVAPSPEALRFKTALELEGALDPAALLSDRSRLLGQLFPRLSSAESQTLVDASESLRRERITPRSFYSTLESIAQNHGLGFGAFPQLERYRRYLVAADGLDGPALMSDLIRWEKNVYAALAANDGERRVIDEIRRCQLVRKLSDFSLSAEEWREYARSGTAGQQPRLRDAEEFYLTASHRDEHMARAAVQAVHGRPGRVAVLVCGGFHAPGIDRRLAEAGIASITFVPRLTQLPSESGAAALSAFLRDKTPLDRLISGERLFLASDPGAALRHGYLDVDAGRCALTTEAGGQIRSQHGDVHATSRTRPDGGSSGIVVVESDVRSPRAEVRLTHRFTRHGVDSPDGSGAPFRLDGVSMDDFRPLTAAFLPAAPFLLSLPGQLVKWIAPTSSGSFSLLPVLLTNLAVDTKGVWWMQLISFSVNLAVGFAIVVVLRAQRQGWKVDRKALVRDFVVNGAIVFLVMGFLGLGSLTKSELVAFAIKFPFSAVVMLSLGVYLGRRAERNPLRNLNFFYFDLGPRTIAALLLVLPIVAWASNFASFLILRDAVVFHWVRPFIPAWIFFLVLLAAQILWSGALFLSQWRRISLGGVMALSGLLSNMTEVLVFEGALDPLPIMGGMWNLADLLMLTGLVLLGMDLMRVNRTTQGRFRWAIPHWLDDTWRLSPPRLALISLAACVMISVPFVASRSQPRYLLHLGEVVLPASDEYLGLPAMSFLGGRLPLFDYGDMRIKMVLDPGTLPRLNRFMKRLESAQVHPRFREEMTFLHNEAKTIADIRDTVANGSARDVFGLFLDNRFNGMQTSIQRMALKKLMEERWKKIGGLHVDLAEIDPDDFLKFFAREPDGPSNIFLRPSDKPGNLSLPAWSVIYIGRSLEKSGQERWLRLVEDVVEGKYAGPAVVSAGATPANAAPDPRDPLQRGVAKNLAQTPLGLGLPEFGKNLMMGIEFIPPANSFAERLARVDGTQQRRATRVSPERLDALFEPKTSVGTVILLDRVEFRTLTSFVRLARRQAKGHAPLLLVRSSRDKERAEALLGRESEVRVKVAGRKLFQGQRGTAGYHIRLSVAARALRNDPILKAATLVVCTPNVPTDARATTLPGLRGALYVRLLQDNNVVLTNFPLLDQSARSARHSQTSL